MKNATAIGLALLCATVPCIAPCAAAAQARWAAASDPVAQRLIEQEREWATETCTPNNVIAGFIADDFVGTSPRGGIYTKSELTREHNQPAPPARDCKMISARLRYFGPDVAVIYGSESAVTTGKDGKDVTRVLVWTDTVLRRGGKWQVIAVQDMVPPTH